jgi:hypothetical protein
MDNVKHKPGGGDKKIFDDKEYLKQIDHPMAPTTPPAQVNFEFQRNELVFFFGLWVGTGVFVY